MNKLFYKYSFYGIALGTIFCTTQLMAQRVSNKQPWSVRMVESEMIRCPESWQLDFQPQLKWDYCHGLELQAMLDEPVIAVPEPEQGDTIVVARDGTGKYRTIQEAVESVRAFMHYTVTIYIKEGVYKEKLVIPSWIKNVQLIGESAEGTIITYDDHANINKMGTFRTYTVKVEGSKIVFKDLTIENNAAQLGQAVALHTEGDDLTFINCRFLGNQDTIYTGSEGSRLLFTDCYIEGTTDFIFGPSTAFFEHCVIHSKRNSYITAASTPGNVEIGYVFKNCRLTAAPGIDKVYLGRPWRPYGATVFLNCEMGDHIVPAGWHNWGKPENEKTARYSEYASKGPGANPSGRVKWSKQLTDKEIRKYTR